MPKPTKTFRNYSELYEALNGQWPEFYAALAASEPMPGTLAHWFWWYGHVDCMT
jgi:hypothetical protein